MAGRKVFTSGEILTAADVNSFLMDQSVMVFADSTARSSAIPSPSEGMVTFREDQDVVEVYDGSAFKTVGGLVALKSALKTDTESFGSVAAGTNVAVTDLSITHEVADAANRLIITAFFGVAAHSADEGECAIAVHDGTNLIAVGNAAGARARVTAGGRTTDGGSGVLHANPTMSVVHTPGAGSKTYTVRAINTDQASATLFINRGEIDDDVVNRVRGASSLIIQEVAV